VLRSYGVCKFRYGLPYVEALERVLRKIELVVHHIENATMYEGAEGEKEEGDHRNGAV